MEASTFHFRCFPTKTLLSCSENFGQSVSVSEVEAILYLASVKLNNAKKWTPRGRGDVNEEHLVLAGHIQDSIQLQQVDMTGIRRLLPEPTLAQPSHLKTHTGGPFKLVPTFTPTKKKKKKFGPTSNGSHGLKV